MSTSSKSKEKNKNVGALLAVLVVAGASADHFAGPQITEALAAPTVSLAATAVSVDVVHRMFFRKQSLGKVIGTYSKGVSKLVWRSLKGLGTVSQSAVRTIKLKSRPAASTSKDRHV